MSCRTLRTPFLCNPVIKKPTLFFSLSLRTKLALVALSLLALPWVGYRYVKEMERFLLEGQQQALLSTANAVATALHERPQLMRLSETRRPLTPEERAAALALSPGESVEMTPTEIARESAAIEEKAVAEVQAILRGLERSTSRIWVVNRELKLVALAGSLKRPTIDKTQEKTKDGEDKSEALPTRGWNALSNFILPRPVEDFDDAIQADVLANGSEVTKAMLGAPATRLRNSPDSRAVIASAAYPIWSHDTVVGAVVVEETTNSILSVRSHALERLLLVTLTVFALAAVLLLGFASRLSTRIRRLRDEAESAVDADGRLNNQLMRLVTASNSGDEIGDLSRSFSAVLQKLSQHHGYLESLAGRLSHELRTPIAVVRSSLENLRMNGVADNQLVYVERAEEGLLRLTKIFARMSEATRLEQSLQTEARENFDVAKVLQACVQGYMLAYPALIFEYSAPDQAINLYGSPDLIAQMLDKLVANAADFTRADRPIQIGLTVNEGCAELCVANQGPVLPEAIRDRLFDSMISERIDRSDAEPHLGLGLYIAKQIAVFHVGTISARNLPDSNGVMVVVSLPLTVSS